MLRTLGGYALGATALIACPCHLPLTLPLLLAVLGGTSLGALLAANSGVVFLAVTVYFVTGLAAAWWLLARGSGASAMTSREDGAAGMACCVPTVRSRTGQPVDPAEVAGRV